MLEHLRLLGDTERSIIVQTRLGRDIANDIPAPAGLRGVASYGMLRQTHGRQWRNRKPATDGYNCFGMLFAARRPVIRESADVRHILADDGYRPLRPGERPFEDDVVFYVDADSKDLLHAARVVRVETLAGAHGGAPVIWVLSKWNDTVGEDEHHIRDVPYESQGFKWSTEMWTDRP